MSRKIKHQQYEFVVQFKTDNCLSINAQFLPTNQHFSNNSVELMRINKDTVLASLQRKSQKNLRCQFQQLVEDGNKFLQIVFIVNFDFLPEFREEVRLNYIQFKQSLKTLNLVNMRAELDQMQRILQGIQTNGTTTAREIGSFTPNNQKKQIWSMKVNRGKYILRVSGTMNNTSGMGQSDVNQFFITTQGQAQSKFIALRTHYQASYQLPFFFSQILQCEDGNIKVEVNTKMASSNLYNVNIVLKRVAEIC